jgi:hypothetical protein
MVHYKGEEGEDSSGERTLPVFSYTFLPVNPEGVYASLTGHLAAIR